MEHLIPFLMPLKSVISKLKKHHADGKKTQVVFDLDSTLFCVSPRTQVILRELAIDPDLSRKFPEAASKLTQIEVTPLDWGIRSVLIRNKIMATLEFFEIVRVKWSERFFSSQYLHHDLPYPGAIEFVKRVEAEGAQIYYLTGRDRPRMEKGTLEGFERHGLPLKSASHLHMKPHTGRHDAEFKREVMRGLQTEVNPTWFFENEPVIINLVRPDFRDLNIIFVDSIHSGRETEPKELERIGMDYRFAD